MKPKSNCLHWTCKNGTIILPRWIAVSIWPLCRLRRIPMCVCVRVFLHEWGSSRGYIRSTSRFRKAESSTSHWGKRYQRALIIETDSVKRPFRRYRGIDNMSRQFYFIPFKKLLWETFNFRFCHSSRVENFPYRFVFFELSRNCRPLLIPSCRV